MMYVYDYFVCVRVPRFLLLAIHLFLPFRLLPFRFFPPFFLLVHLVKQLFPLLVGLYYASSFASRVFFLPIFLSKQMKRRKGRKKTKRKNPKKSRGKKKIFFQSAKTRTKTNNTKNEKTLSFVRLWRNSPPLSKVGIERAARLRSSSGGFFPQPPSPRSWESKNELIFERNIKNSKFSRSP